MKQNYELKYNTAYYIVKDKPDGMKAPYFFESKWIPELPDYNYLTLSSDIILNDSYEMKAKTYQLECDVIVNEHLISTNMIKLFDLMNVKYSSRPVDLTLHKNKKTKNSYHVFFLNELIDIMDVDKSIYTVASDKYSGQLYTPEEMGCSYTHYDRIQKLILKDNITSSLFVCRELKEIVCSGSFKNKFEEFNLSGVDFIPLDSTYQYDPFKDFCV